MTSNNSNTLQDYLRTMADVAQHERILISSELMRGIEKTNNVNFLNLEYSILSSVEREFLSSLEMEEQWQLKDKSLKMDLSVTVIADSSTGRQLQNTSVVEIDFESKGLYCHLDPIKAYAYDQARERTGFAYDQVKMSRAEAVFSNSSAEVTGGLNMTTTQTRLGLKPDMRHVFQKLYLLLCDYNLAETTNYPTMDVDPNLKFHVYNNTNVGLRMTLINEYQIVVDENGFTPEELSVLTVGAAAYPSVWYAGDNVYNAIEMPADSLAICSANKVEISSSLAFGSPGYLYNTICALACKMGCVQDMMEAFQSMRGKPFLLHNLVDPRDNNGMTIVNDVPLSLSYACATGEVANVWDVLETEGGYFAWSKALLAEGLLGHAYTNTAANFVEEIGGFGNVFGSSTPDTSKVLNGFMRDHGLNHGDHRINSLLLNWGAISGTPLKWGFQLRVKEYVIRLCELAKGSWDVPMPQMQLYNIVNSYKYTCWGRIRNWTGHMLTPFSPKETKMKQLEETICFTWAMGLRQRRPMIHANKKGESKLYLLASEQAFMSAQQGQNFKINSIGVGLLTARVGKVDEVDRIARDFYTSNVVQAGNYITYHHETGWGNVDVVDQTEYRDMDRIERSMRDARESVTDAQSVDGLDNNLYTSMPAKAAEDPVKTADLVTGRKERTPTDQLYITSRPTQNVGSTARMDQDSIPVVMEHTFGDGEVHNRLVSPDYLREIEDKTVDVKWLDEQYGDSGALPAMLHAMAVMGMVEVTEYYRAGQLGQERPEVRITDNAEIGVIADELGIDARLIEYNSNGDGLVETKLGFSKGPIVRIGKGEDGYQAVFAKAGSKYMLTKNEMDDKMARAQAGRRRLRDTTFGKAPAPRKLVRQY
jgi:hypothetical protein